MGHIRAEPVSLIGPVPVTEDRGRDTLQTCDCCALSVCCGDISDNRLLNLPAQGDDAACPMSEISESKSTGLTM